MLKNKTILRSQQIFKSEGYDVFTQKVKKKTPIKNNDKRLQTYDGAGLKILTLAQIKAGNNSESLLNEIRQIVYSSYQSKEIIKKV